MCSGNTLKKLDFAYRRSYYAPTSTPYLFFPKRISSFKMWVLEIRSHINLKLHRNPHNTFFSLLLGFICPHMPTWTAIEASRPSSIWHAAADDCIEYLWIVAVLFRETAAICGRSWYTDILWVPCWSMRGDQGQGYHSRWRLHHLPMWRRHVDDAWRADTMYSLQVIFQALWWIA